MYKLFERKARCLKALKQYPRALEAMKSAEMWMKYSTLSETKSSSFKKEINKQVPYTDKGKKLKQFVRRLEFLPRKQNIKCQCLIEIRNATLFFRRVQMTRNFLK